MSAGLGRPATNVEMCFPTQESRPSHRRSMVWVPRQRLAPAAFALRSWKTNCCFWWTTFATRRSLLASLATVCQATAPSGKITLFLSTLSKNAAPRTSTRQRYSWVYHECFMICEDILKDVLNIWWYWKISARKTWIVREIQCFPWGYH